MVKSYLFVATVAFASITLLLASCNNDPAESYKSQPKAAIVDQLYLLEPNQAFIEKATETLESYGFSVDLWQGKEITVDFYAQLPRRGYRLIILRVHSGILLALLQGQMVPSKTTYLFTGETYTTTRYVSEQLTDRVSNALITPKYPLVFAVNSDFIKNNLKGYFDNTIIIAMGCETFYLDDMADAFIQRGASAYLGWSGVVSLKHTDSATLELVNRLGRDMTVAAGVADTMTELGLDPYFGAYFKYHPASSGNQTMRELIRQIN